MTNREEQRKGRENCSERTSRKTAEAAQKPWKPHKPRNHTSRIPGKGGGSNRTEQVLFRKKSDREPEPYDPDGPIYGLLGANGAGKEWPVECILGTRRADSGEVRILGWTR